jgi:hypothetical protein
MELFDEATYFYKNSYLITILNILYNYINYFLCILYICCVPIYIIINNNLFEFANENHINYYLILYAFYRIYTMTYYVKSNNIKKDIIASIIYIIIISYDINNNHIIHQIQYWIFHNLIILLAIFVYGTIYMIFNLEINKYDIDNEEVVIEFSADIISDIV